MSNQNVNSKRNRFEKVNSQKEEKEKEEEEEEEEKEEEKEEEEKEEKEEDEEIEEMDVEPNRNPIDEYVERSVLVCLNHIHRIKIEYTHEIELLNNEISQLRRLVEKLKS